MANINELLVLHHSHMDIGYTHPQPVVWELHDRCIDEAIDLCEATAAYPDGSQVKWTCEVTNVVLHWLATASPQQIARMRALVTDGRMSFGAMLCHWTALHPEDLLQQSLLPMQTLRDALGAQFKVAMQTDVNGVTWSTADLLLDAGIQHLMMSINIHMGGYPLKRPEIFRWQAPSGRELTVYSGEHYNVFSRATGLDRADATPATMKDGLDHYLERLAKTGWSHDFAILTATHPMMDDNGPPNPELPELIRQWNDAGLTPRIRLVSVDEIAARIAQINPESLPVHAGDWTDFWSSGVAASALDVVMSRRAHGAWWGARALATRAQDPAIATHLTNARDQLHLANEHTWNTYASTGALGVAGSGLIEPIPEAEQRLHKSNHCAGALSHARMARRLALDELAGNPRQARHQEAMLVFNPSEMPRKVCLRMTPDVAAGSFHLIEGTKQRFDVVEEVLRESSGSAWFGPVEIPPLSLTQIPLETLNHPAAIPNGAHAGAGQIRSPFWQLDYDERSGTIISLLHLASGRECFDGSAGFDLFGALQESVADPSHTGRNVGDPRYDLYRVTEATYNEVVHADHCAWATDWRAKHTRPTGTTRVEASIDAEGAHLTRWLTVPGIRGTMRQTISLLAHEDRVRFDSFFNKDDITDPESLFFTFPFALADAQAHFDTSGVAVAYDCEQLDGACRDWFTAGSYVAVASRAQSGGCITLACPDAPLIQLGAFNYGRRHRDVSHLNQAWVMAWPTNNYWNTNFRASQPGLLRIRYEMRWSPAFDPAESARFAAAVARPPVFHPIVHSSAATPQGPLLAGLAPDVTLVAMGSGANGSVIVGLRNHASEPRNANPTLPGRPLAQLTRLDALHARIEDLPPSGGVVLPGRQTTWLQLSPE